MPRRAPFDPNSKAPFKISRSKIDLFLECPRCFYFDAKLGVRRPRIPGYTLNSAVDILLKKEFDLLRKKGEAHELMKKYKVNAVPYQHPKMEDWRNTFVGVQHLHPKTNLLVFGAVDDVWVNPRGELHVVDYKSTSTERKISLDDEYKQGYKIQMEVYQWLLRKNGFKVSDAGYFVFANAGKNRPDFDGRLEFELSIVPYRGDDSWVEKAVIDIKKCLESSDLPKSSPTCEYSSYRMAFAIAGKRQRKAAE
jgi:CRISPR/Cas system-associated exonuclease Cas4 (RecB family)